MPMTKDQFTRESNFRLALALFKGMLMRHIITPSDYEKAKTKLIERFDPPYGGLTDILTPPLLSG